MNAADSPILLVEDSPEDTEATLRALKRAGLNCARHSLPERR